MSLLQEAVLEQSAAKIGLFGPGGSGKSLTATLIAIALSKTFHNGAPVALQDTEGASDWLLDVYKAEGVKLIRVKSRSFVDMRQALREGEEMGACAFIDDSYSHPWAELQESLKKRLNVKKLEFHHMQELQEMWGEWVRQMLNSPLHCLLCGRLAYEWENDVDMETGKMGFHKAGTKMRSEKDAGYEPHLLIEMEADRVMEEIKQVKQGNRTKKTKIEKKAGGHFVHNMHVLKDRAMALNGLMFAFKDINSYKAGGWKPVYAALEPHFKKLHISAGGNKAIEERSSAALFSGRGDSAYQERVRQVQITLEELEATIVKLWPGSDAKSKALKALVIEVLFKTRSWKAVESKSLEALQAGLTALRLFEEQATNGGKAEALTDSVQTSGLLQICHDKVTSDTADAVENAVL